MFKKAFAATPIQKAKFELRKLFSAFALAAAALASTAPASAQNLLVNGSFETGDLTGWNTPGAALRVTHSVLAALDGVYYLKEASVGGGRISQTFATIAGDSYEISGWASSTGGVAPDSRFYFTWNHQFVLIADALYSPWRNYTVTVTGTGSDTFEFGYFHDDLLIVDYDNFSVTHIPSTAAVPEPETYAMMLAGLGLLGFAARRRKQVVDA